MFSIDEVTILVLVMILRGSFYADRPYSHDYLSSITI